MKGYVPSYYNEFKCIADKCIDSCCTGWDVDIDNDTAEIYKNSDVEKIKNKLTEDGFGYMFSLENNRCPFLNCKNLCDIQIEKGEDYLCRTCKLFPRYVECYKDFCEMGLGFACPEAARIILNYDKPVQLIDNGDVDEIPEETDEEFFSSMLFLRKMVLDELDTPLPLKDKLSMIVELVSEFDDKERTTKKSFNSLIDIMLEFEYIDESRKKYISSLKEKSFTGKCVTEYEKDFLKLMKYYVFRYFLTSSYDYFPLEKIKFGIFACIIISRIYENTENLDFEKRVDIMYKFSRELEYSQDNLDALSDGLYEISAKNLIKLL
ncbi:MAG: flagellin lysine-N-methylase [Ruminococcus sp.]|nr:flagellin lysine-N-methylase [Candidatus Copronaster equi]